MYTSKQELQLLYQYSGPSYLAELRDTWQMLITHVEHCLALFKQNLRPDCRSRHVSHQPDVAWQSRVLPNFRATFSALCDGEIKLRNGDITGLQACYGPLSDFKGQSDFDTSWMGSAALETYGKLLNKSVRIASNIRATESAQWQPFDLSSEYDPAVRGVLSLPAQSATFRLSSLVKVASQSAVSTPGVYVPHVEHSCAEFLVPYRAAPKAFVFRGRHPLFHPVTGEVYGHNRIIEAVDCEWILVEPINTG